jgi:POT family proton-dependent oligopeptide transporter
MKQPRAITPLFFTEAWERFGYYSVQGILVLFLIQTLHFSDQLAFVTLGEFLSWTYIAPVFGGLIANYLLGYRYAILIGCSILALGYGLLAYSSALFLHLALSCIVVGNGLLKPNTASFLGLFYYHDDPRRYSGFTFYFTGINIGGLAAILLANLASHYFGYHAVFITAFFGMILAGLVFRLSFREFENRGWPPQRRDQASRWLRALSFKPNLIMLLLVVILTVRFLQHHAHISSFLLLILTLGVIISLFYWQSTVSTNSHHRLIAVILLTAMSILFWAESLQIFFSLLLFTDRFVDRQVFDWSIPPSLFIILEPSFLLMLGPLLAKLWTYLSKQQREPSPALKFSGGLGLMGLAMSLLAFSTYYTPDQQLISPWWIVSFYVLMTLGMLLISPTGLAMITELAPQKMTGFMMGIWYMVIGLGSLLASVLALYTSSDINAQTGLKAAQEIYGEAFLLYAMIAFLACLLLLIVSPKIRKLINNPL